MNAIMQPDASLAEKLNRLLSGPAEPDRFFIFDKLTYSRVYETAGGLAMAFSAGSDQTPVCLCTERKDLMAASILAALSARTRLLLPFALSATALADLKQETGFTRAVADDPGALPPGVAAAAPDQNARAALALRRDVDEPFLHIYTGGSTGRPRLWAKTPRNLFAEAFFMARKFNIGPEDRFLAAVPPYHIYGLLFSVLIPLVASASAAETIPAFPQEIIQEIENRQATIFAAAPIHYRSLNRSEITKHALRLAISSAGPLDPADGAAFFQNSGVGVTEIYGSTETGGVAARRRAAGEAAFTPLSCIDWKIADERLHIRSAFISPDLSLDADGFFAAGDRVAPDGGGFLLLGRVDGVVKVSGKRVDLKEIEDHLKSLPGVRDALVIALPADGGRETDIHALAAGSADPNQLKEALSRRFEAYALPRSVKVADAVPTLSTGKYDTQAVRAMFRPDPDRNGRR